MDTTSTRQKFFIWCSTSIEVVEKKEIVEGMVLVVKELIEMVKL